MTARWSSGWDWEPSPDEVASLWGDVNAGAGWPDVILAGVTVTDRCTGVSWASGRSWWLSDPEPGSASVQLQGRLEGTPIAALTVGDVLELRAEPVGLLWRGWVDSITETTEPQDGELAYGLAIAASDRMSRLLSAELYHSVALVAGTLEKRLADLATAAGVPGPQTIRVLSTTGTLPQLVARTLAGTSAQPLTLGDHLAECERASNAITAVARDGSWLILPRARVTDTPDVTDLDGDSDPNHLDRAIATPERVRNVFTIAGVLTEVPASIARHGRRAYDVPAGVSATPPPYAPETLTALATPAPFAAATIPIATRTAAAVALEPFDWCRVSTRPPDEYYQLLAMSWSAQPDVWELGVQLDRTQMSIAAPPDPENPDPPNPTPPTTATVTETFRVNRSAYIVKTTGGLEAGNGASVDLLVGLLADGNLARGMVRFDLPWRGKVVSVGSAKLRLRGGATTCAGFGGSPSFRVRRITEGWSSGTYSARCAFSSSNAVVWPGPSVTATGEKVGAGPKSTNDWAEFGIVDIVRAWASGSSNYGLSLRGASESSSADRAPVWSNVASSGDRPELVVTYTYEV